MSFASFHFGHDREIWSVCALRCRGGGVQKEGLRRGPKTGKEVHVVQGNGRTGCWCRGRARVRSITSSTKRDSRQRKKTKFTDLGNPGG